MKKILLFFVALFACVGSAWAETIVTDPATQMVDGTYITLQCMDYNGGDGYYFNGATTKSPALQVSNFYKIVSNGESAFYLQRVSDSKYVANSSNVAALVDETSDANAFTFSIAEATGWTTASEANLALNGNSTVRFTTTNSTGSAIYLNTNAKANTPKFANGTGGYSIWLVKTYTEDEVKAPAFSGNYAFKNNRSGKYACWAGDNTQISQSSTVALAGVWTITPNGDGSFKLGNKATSNYYNSTTSFTAEGKSVYFGLSTLHTACVNISESSEFAGSCWDDQDQHTHVGYWNANDEGTSWTLEAVADDAVLKYAYNDALAKANEAYNSLNYKSADLITSECTFDNTCGHIYNEKEGEHPEYLIDGDANTYWHTDWSGTCTENPHWIAIDYPEALTDGTYQLTVVRRNSYYDHVTEFTVYGKNGDSWDEIAVVELPFNAAGETKTATFDLTGSYSTLKFAATATTNSRTYWHAAELQLNKVVTNRSLYPTEAAALKEKIDATPSYTEEAIKALQDATDAFLAAALKPEIPEDKLLSIGEKANTVTPATSNSDNDHWYLMSQVRGGESPMYDNGVGNTLKRAAATVTPASLDGAVVAENTQYLVRFFETSTGVYNIQFATGNYIQTTLTTGELAGAGEYFVYNINDEDTHIGWNISSDGTYGSIVDNNAAGNTLAFWGTGKVSTSGGNNDWCLYPVEFTDAPVYYTITYKTSDNLWSQEYKAKEGGSYPTPDAGYFVEFTDVPTGTVTGNEEVTLSYKTRYVLNSADSDTDTWTWYAIDIHGNEAKYPLYCGETDEVRVEYKAAVDADDYTRGTVKNDTYMWAFIGENPFLGIKLYNRGAGQFAYQANDADEKIKFADEGTEFKVCATTSGLANSFAIKADGRKYYFNHRGEYVQGWTAADGGSSLRAYPIHEDPYSSVEQTLGAQYGTLVIPFYSLIPDGLKVYTCSTIDGTTLELTEETTIIKANTAYIVEGTEGRTYGYGNGTLGDYTEPVTTGVLTGVYERTTVEKGNYVLQNHSGAVGFYQVEEGGFDIDANRCYLTVPEGTSASNGMIRISGGTVTAIDAVEALTSGNTEIFDLQGRRINSLQKGVNIVNGHKVLVK